MRFRIGAVTAALLALGAAGQAAQQQAQPAETPQFAGKAAGFATLCKPDHHEGPSELTPDGKTLYFTRANADFSTSTVRQATWRDGAWHEDGAAPFATSSYDAGASLTPDGKRLYFTSQRPAQGFADTWNLWVAERDSAGGWAAPKALEAPLNSDKSECCLTAKAAGAVYFSSERDGSWDIFRASRGSDGKLTGVERLPAGINGADSMEWPSYVDPQERFLIFSSIRPGGQGGDDLYVSLRGADGWGPPRNLGPLVNTKGFEDSGVISPDGKRLLWSSRTQGASDIYEIDVDQLGIPELGAR
jgi:Tol biopolymer transport system component